jgi:riboflavin kinase/FMN adenylyltransferase
MKILESLKAFKNDHKPLILTIGNFDGVHRGHQWILQRCREVAGPDGEVVVITFSNHPSEVLRPDNTVPFLCTLEHKIRLIEAHQVNTLCVLRFTHTLAHQSSETFIEKVRSHIPFTHLVLGHDATLGRNRQGSPLVMQELAQRWDFSIEYRPEYRYHGQPVSSTLIRESLQKGNLSQVENLLGRPYSIYSTVIPGKGRGEQLGFPTANMNVNNLCLPPLGVYAVTVHYDNQILQGVANLGVAPTVRHSNAPILETHLFSNQGDLYGKNIEVIFNQFIRPETKFSSLDELKNQIEKDICTAKNHFVYNPSSI